MNKTRSFMSKLGVRNSVSDTRFHLNPQFHLTPRYSNNPLR